MDKEIRKLQADGVGDVEIAKIYKDKLEKNEITKEQWDEVEQILHDTAEKRDAEELFGFKL